MPRNFKKFTTNLRLIQKQLDKIKLEISPQPQGIKNTTPRQTKHEALTIWSYFSHYSSNVGISKTFASLKSLHPMSQNSSTSSEIHELPQVQNTLTNIDEIDFLEDCVDFFV